MTIEEVKKSIEEKLGGYQIDPIKIRDYIENPSFMTEDYTPTMWLFNFTEIEMPEECFDSVYCIPTAKDNAYIQEVINGDLCSPAECLVFLGTKDGVNAEYICSAFPYETTITQINNIRDIISNRK